MFVCLETYHSVSELANLVFSQAYPKHRSNHLRYPWQVSAVFLHDPSVSVKLPKYQLVHNYFFLNSYIRIINSNNFNEPINYIVFI